MVRSKNHKIVLLVLIIVAVLVGSGIGVFCFDYSYRQYDKVREEVTIESGSPITLDLFFKEMLPDARFITDVSLIDTSVPASYAISIHAWKFDKKVTLNIVDTTPPTGKAVSQIIYADCLPPVENCVKNVMDLAQVNVEYLDAFPDVHTGGQRDIPVKISDIYGNTTIIDVPFYIIADNTPPVIYGTHNMEYWIGETIQYREGIVVRDNYDTDPSFTIDNSAVNPDVEGVYPVIYSATDEAGNTTEVVISVSIYEKPDDYEDMLLVYDLAQQLLDEITTPEMSQVEKAFRIFQWARYNIHYVGNSDKRTWVTCALEGFTYHRGDCYTYYCCCHALLDLIGVDNMMVERYPISHSRHFWNLICIDNQWYHCDSTPFENNSGFTFMAIDSELGYRNRFDSDAYPERATESYQHRLNFTTLEVSEE